MSQISIPSTRLAAYRLKTYCLQTGSRLTSAEQANLFVNQRGFVFFWPVKGIDCPSLWVASAGDRPVPDEHDDPGHITWDWKDKMLDQRKWYYARCLAQRNAMISLSLLPVFYALSPNYGDPITDIQQEYHQGILRLETKQVFDALESQGPLDTLSLRKAARLSSPESDGRFNRALNDLQMAFRVLPVGISQAGGWRYAFIYDLVHRYYPTLIQEAQPISQSYAREHILLTYLRSVGISDEHAIIRLFKWRKEDTHRTINALVASRKVLANIQVSEKPGSWLAIPELADEHAV